MDVLFEDYDDQQQEQPAMNNDAEDQVEEDEDDEDEEQKDCHVPTNLMDIDAQRLKDKEDENLKSLMETTISAVDNDRSNLDFEAKNVHNEKNEDRNDLYSENGYDQEIDGNNDDENDDDDDDEEEEDDDDNVQITIGDFKSGLSQSNVVGTTAGGYINLNLQKGGRQFAQPGGGLTGNKALGTGTKPSLDLNSVGQYQGLQIYDVNLDTLEEKPWRKPGADITDYFNYGFNEDTWKVYCERQRKIRQLNQQGQFDVNAVLNMASGLLNKPLDQQGMNRDLKYLNQDILGKGFLNSDQQSSYSMMSVNENSKYQSESIVITTQQQQQQQQLQKKNLSIPSLTPIGFGGVVNRKLNDERGTNGVVPSSPSLGHRPPSSTSTNSSSSDAQQAISVIGNRSACNPPLFPPPSLAPPPTGMPPPLSLAQMPPFGFVPPPDFPGLPRPPLNLPLHPPPGMGPQFGDFGPPLRPPFHPGQGILGSHPNDRSINPYDDYDDRRHHHRKQDQDSFDRNSSDHSSSHHHSSSRARSRDHDRSYYDDRRHGSSSNSYRERDYEERSSSRRERSRERSPHESSSRSRHRDSKTSKDKDSNEKSSKETTSSSRSRSDSKKSKHETSESHASSSSSKHRSSHSTSSKSGKSSTSTSSSSKRDRERSSKSDLKKDDSSDK